MVGAGALRAHLVAARLAGVVATPREESLRSYRMFAAGDPRYLIGCVPYGSWGVPELLRLMAARCGVSPDPAYTRGQDRIDPDRTVAALDAFADRLAVAARRREPVLFGTGHPRWLLGFYAGLAGALSAAGGVVVTPTHGRCIDISTRFGLRPHVLDQVRGVALVRAANGGGSGAHTHSPLPVRAALEAAAAGGGPLPALVVGDHGWACGAGQLGIEAMGPADVDDPAVFVAEAEGQVSVAVPLDDGARSGCYRLLTRYVLNRARLCQ